MADGVRFFILIVMESPLPQKVIPFTFFYALTTLIMLEKQKLRRATKPSCHRKGQVSYTAKGFL